MECEIKKEDIIKSDSIKELAEALSKAQARLHSVNKGEQGYGYNYASLASTIETAKPILAEFGLSISQLLGSDGGSDGKKASITTLLMHSSGEFLGSTAEIAIIDMKGCNEAQSKGASISYLRRYALQAILNMASEDNDASSEGPKKANKPAIKQEGDATQASRPSGFGRK
jgi:hypothetical protein